MKVTISSKTLEDRSAINNCDAKQEQKSVIGNVKQYYVYIKRKYLKMVMRKALPSASIAARNRESNKMIIA